MNSSQRRSVRRRFQHEVIIQISSDVRYFEWDEHVHGIREWADQTFGKDNWRVIRGWAMDTFLFTNEQDAVIFSLRWS